MLPLERQNKILEILEKKQAVTVEELCAVLYSSGATIRRDLQALEHANYLTNKPVIYIAGKAPISQALFDRLFEIEHIDGIKWTSSNYYEMMLLRQYHPEITIFNGPDEMLLCGLSAGADGGIGTTYNFMLPLYQGILKNFKEGNMAGALELQEKSARIIQTYHKYPGIPLCKLILEEMGIPVGNACRPLKKLSPEVRKQAILDLRNAGLEV